MAISISVWEDSGIIGSPGSGPSVRHEVDNLGFKDSGLDETFTFADYPIGRDANGSPLLNTYSYKKYYYFKFSGTYTDITSMFIAFEGDPEGVAGSTIADNVHIVYKMTNVYEVPDNVELVGTIYDPLNPPEIVPNLSTVGPENATSVIPPVANTTYYTNYIVAQLVIEPSSNVDFGNLDEAFNLKFSLNESKTGLPGFDEDTINWSP